MFLPPWLVTDFKGEFKSSVAHFIRSNASVFDFKADYTTFAKGCRMKQFGLGVMAGFHQTQLNRWEVCPDQLAIPLAIKNGRKAEFFIEGTALGEFLGNDDRI